MVSLASLQSVIVVHVSIDHTRFLITIIAESKY